MDFRQLYWYGTNGNDTNDAVFCTLTFFDAFRYLIFKYRLRKKLPEAQSLFEELKFFILNIFRASKNLKNVSATRTH
jgi:hypothetical protein